jgi:hypothetical protein
MDNILFEPVENYRTGYIKIFRSIKTHWLYEKNRKRTKLEAWYDLLLRASHCAEKETVGYDFIEVFRGQILTSQEGLAKDWRWDRSAVRSFINSLHRDQMLTIKSTNTYTMLTICNYECYQGNSPSLSPTNQHQPITHSTHSINDKELKKEIYSQFIFFNNGFTTVWKSFKDMRVKVKSPLTLEAERLNLIDLSKLCKNDKELAIKIVNQSIQKGWKGFFPLKSNYESQQLLNQQDGN